MKKQIVAVKLPALSLTLSAYSQGTVAFENYDGGAGLVLRNGVPDAATYIVALYGGALGSSFSQLTLLATFTVTAGSGNTPGNFHSGLEPSIPGVARGGNGTLAILAWDGGYPTYAVALEVPSELFGSTGTFSNPAGGAGTPPMVGAYLTGMPTLDMAFIPEPSIIALGSLGCRSGCAVGGVRQRRWEANNAVRKIDSARNIY